jgi:predicted ATPase
VEGQWEALVVEDVESLAAVRSVVGKRVSRLATDVQELLRLATVVGQEFDVLSQNVLAACQSSILLSPSCASFTEPSCSHSSDAWNKLRCRVSHTAK